MNCTDLECSLVAMPTLTAVKWKVEEPLFFFSKLYHNCVVLDFQGLRNYFERVGEIVLHFFSHNHILGPFFFESYASPREILPLALIGRRKC